VATRVRQGTWEYSGDPATSDKDAVRFLMHDTNDEDQLMSDEEILWLVAEEGSDWRAAARGLDVLATRFASLVDKAVGDLKLSLSQRAENFASRAADLRSGGSHAIPVPVATGLSISEKRDVEADTDRVPSHFRVGMDDNLGTSVGLTRWWIEE